MFYLSADPLNQIDMIKRAKTHKAEACILLTNKNSPNSSEEDYRNILIALAVKKFVYDERKEGIEKDIALCMQLIKPESKDLYYKSLNLSPLQDQLIIVEEIKMNLLAKSCFSPGLISMISNLISSSGDLECDKINKSDWFAEYAAGMGMEIYCSKLEPMVYPDQIKFAKFAEIAYSEYNTIVFALEIQSKPEDGKIPSSIIRLNPVDFVFKWNDFNNYVYKLHMICDDAE